MGFDGWLQIFEELTYRSCRHLWEQEEQQMEGAGGRFHMNTGQNFPHFRSGEVSGSPMGGVQELWDSFLPRMLQAGFSIRKELDFGDF